MSDKKNNDAFELLNTEFANHDLEKENARNLEYIRKKQRLQQREDDAWSDGNDEYEEEKEGRGCAGTVFRIMLILLLAAALSWLVFMPEGSLGELWNEITPGFESAFSWAVGLFTGDGDKVSSGAGNGISDPAESDSDPESQDSSIHDEDENLPDDNDSNVGTVDSDSDPTDVSTDTDDSPYRITVYRPSQIVIVYDSAGNPAKIFSCSSGKASTPTKLGEYAIRAKYRWRFMVGNCYTQYASSFSSGYLFHSIPYNKKNPGTMSDSSYDKLGNPASSGCIRLCFRDTKWIYDNCPIGTKVSVIDQYAPAGTVPEIIPERIKDSAHSGWDPTDDSPDNPYNR